MSDWNRPAINGGLMAFSRLRREHARFCVEVACGERMKYRELEEFPEVSEAEVDLVAALQLIGAGDHFTLQHPIGPYDADIYFVRELLVVEVDGREWHNARTNGIRDRYMARQGIKTVRVRAGEVWRDPIAVAKFIAAQVGLRRREIRRAS